MKAYVIKEMNYIKREAKKAGIIIKPENTELLLLLINKIWKKLNTINLKRCALRAYLYEKFDKTKKIFSIIEWGFNKVKRKKENEKKTWDIITDEELKLLLFKSNNTLTSKIIKFLAISGIRITELINIKHENIECFNEKVRIKIITCKSKQIVYKIISNKFYKQINNSFHGNIYLFETTGGKKCNRNNIHKEMVRLSEKYINKHITPNCFRHYFITNSFNKKIPLYKISESVGHLHPESTVSNYLHENI